MEVTEKRKYTRLSPAIWAEIEANWETGSVTLAELAARHGVTIRTLQSHFAKRGVEKGRAAGAIATAVKAEIMAGAIEDRAQAVKLANAARQRSYENACLIENLIMSELDKASKSPADSFRASAAIKTLSLAAQALERTNSIKMGAIGITDDELISRELPEIRIVDLRAEDLAKLREADEFDDGADFQNSLSSEDDEVIDTMPDAV